MTNQRSQARLCLLAILFVVTVGCSGTDDDALPPLDPEPAETIAEETTTSTAETTTTTETATTTEAETTVAPELDPANWNSDLDEIFGRYLLYWQALDVAYMEADPDYPPLSDLIGAEALVDFRADVDQNYRQTGQVLVVAADSLEEHVLRLPRPTDLGKTEGNEVIIQDCWIADRTKQTLDGEVLETWSFPTVFNVTMAVIDDEWRVFASVTAEDGSDGWSECNEYFANLDQ